MLRKDLLANASRSRALLVAPAFAAVVGLGHGAAHAQWATFFNDTSTRIPTGPGLNSASLSTTDPEEKDYAWADLDNDGDVDLVCVRKVPFTFAGGRRNVLFMNENGTLVDRASTLANTSINVPASEITQANNMSPAIPGWLGSSQGFLDPTNDRDVVIGDVNNDGWLDVITATTISDVNNSSQPYYLPRFLGHPRVYINQGEVAGVWQGLRYDYNCIPQMLSKSGTPWHPRFCSLAVGDVTGDGYADLYFGDYDTSQIGPSEPGGTDFDNKLLINVGAGNPGVFVDESVARMGSIFNYPDTGAGNYLVSAFGAASIIADMNGDGHNDVVKQTALQAPQHVAVVYNNPANVGMFNQYKIVTAAAPYFVSTGDLNNDGRLDLIVTDDNVDHYHLNLGNAADGTANFGNANFIGSQSGEFGGQSVAADLNNDGFQDVLIADVDVDGFGCARRMRIFQNFGNVPNVTMQEASPSIIPTNMLTGTHNVAVFDINGDNWNDLVVGRCNSTEVWMNAGVDISADKLPVLVDPSSGTPVDVTISAAATIVAGSAKVHISVNGGAFSETTMTPLGGNDYQAVLPAGACGDELRYYFSVQAQVGASVSTYTLPNNAPASNFRAVRALDQLIALNEEFEGSVASWSVQNVSLTSGAWEAADPVGTVNSGQVAAPEDDATPAPGVKAFITQNGAPGGAAGAADIDGGPTHLISPTLDASSGEHYISYSYWLYTSETGTSGDTLTVAVSNNNGASWTTVKVINTSSLGWKQESFRVSNFVTPNDQLRVRFSAIDGGTASIAEAGIDDFRLEEIVCDNPCPADVNGDGSVNVSDLLSVISTWGPCSGCPTDINGDGAVNVSDLLSVIGAWGACP